MKANHKPGKRLSVLLLAAILLTCSACGAAPKTEQGSKLPETVSAADGKQFLMPSMVADNDHYREAEPTEFDASQGQVAAYRPDLDALPDVDVYVFEYAGDPEKYAQEQAMLFGTQAFPTEIGGSEGYGFVSAEHYDDGWTVVTDLICPLDETRLQELCLYDKTQPVTLVGSDLCVHIPMCYEPTDREKEAGVVQTYTTVRAKEDAMSFGAHTIDTVFVEGVSPKELLPELARSTARNMST